MMAALDALAKPLTVLGQRLEAMIEEAPDWLDGAARARIEGAMASLGWRIDTLRGWIALLGRGGGPADPDFVDWLTVERGEGREFDMGLHRHWLDPTRPVSAAVLKPAHGVLTTSATLRSGGDWDTAEARTGAAHLDHKSAHFAANSPFDYAAQSEVLIVTDVQRGDMPALAGAYAALIAASQGGTLGLFTAIKRLAQCTCPHCRPARARRVAAICAACRPDGHRHAGRYFPRRSARVAARHRCVARWHGCAGRIRCGWW